MDINLRREVEKAVSKVYEDVKERRVTGVATQTANRAAMEVMNRLENQSSYGIGVPGDPENKSVTPMTKLEIRKRVAMLYVEILLTDLKEKDPTHPKLWDRLPC